MTPLDSPRSPAELRYNAAHAATRQVAQRTFRAIRSRFRCLDGTKGYLQVFPASGTAVGGCSGHALLTPRTLFPPSPLPLRLSPPSPSAVFPREERRHPAGLLRPPQRLPAVGTRRLGDGGAGGGGGGGGGVGGGAEERGERGRRRGDPEESGAGVVLTARSGAAARRDKAWADTGLLRQRFNILLVATLLTTLDKMWLRRNTPCREEPPGHSGGAPPPSAPSDSSVFSF